MRKTKFKGIKKTLKILAFVFGGIVLFFGALFILLNTSKVQQNIAQKITDDLSDRINSKVGIGNVKYSFFNALNVKDFYVEDLNQDTIMYVDEIKARFRLFKMLRGKFIFTSIELNQFEGYLTKDEKGTNLDFIIEAFKNPNKKENNSSYQIKNLRLYNSSFRFNNLSYPETSAKENFDGRHLHFKDIQLDLALNIFQKDSFDIELNSFSASERSGLTLTDLSTKISGNSQSVTLPDFELSMPFSKIRFEETTFRYTEFEDWKDFVNKVKLSVPFKNGSYVNLKDLSAFIPEFKWMNNPVMIEGVISGNISKLRAQNLKLTYGKSFEFEADIDMNGLPDIEETFVFGQIKSLHFTQDDLGTFIADFLNQQIDMPEEIKRLGLIAYKGNISGFFSNMVVYGNLSTQIGEISTDILLQFENRMQDLRYSGSLRSKDLNLNKLLANEMLGTASFNFKTKGIKRIKQAIQGDVEATITEFQLYGYNYQDILFNGKYDGSGFDGIIQVEDENIHAEFAGVIDLTERLPAFNFGLTVENADINALNISKKYKDSNLSFKADMNMVGNSFDNINGFVRFDSISFTNNNSTLNVDNVLFKSVIDKNITEISIQSDYLNGTIAGDYKYSRLKDAFMNIAQHYIPALSKNEQKKQTYYNQLALDLQLNQVSDIAKVLEFPIDISKGARLSGFVNEESNLVDLSLNIPEANTNKRKLSDIRFDLKNKENKIDLSAYFNLYQSKKEYIAFKLDNSIDRDTLFTHFDWRNNTDSIINSGKISTLTHFLPETESIFAKVNILPADIVLIDSLWHITPSVIDIGRDSTITFHDFRMDGSKQYLHIKGTASKDEEHQLNLDLNNVNLGFIMKILGVNGIKLDAFVTGEVSLFNVLEKPLYTANLSAKELFINDKEIGDGILHSTWDPEKKRILFDGDFTKVGVNVALADGYYDTQSNAIRIVFDAKRLSVAFVERYFGGLVSDFEGLASGKLTWFGPANKLQFEGKILVEEGKGTVNPLKTTYYFDDYVNLTANSIFVSNFKISDSEKNDAAVNGKLEHNGSFRNLKYDFNAQAKNLLAMNLQSTDNDYFWGKAYADGMVRIHGDEEVVNIYANAISKPRTKCYIQMGGAASTASDNSFIRFVKHDKEDEEIEEDEKTKTFVKSDTNVKINLQIEVTPDADIELIIDSRAGDMIAGKANGNIRLELDSYSDLRLFGGATIESGYYLFTLQNVLRKEFKIAQGSTITFVGDPYDTQANIQALYTVNTSLRDLMDNTAVSRANIPVVCVLNLSERLMNPVINFDVELPSSDELVRQQVKSVLSTEEMMNRQILYLLVVGKFYRPEYMRNDMINTTTSDAMSFGWSTLSAQINNWLSQAFNSNVLSLGFDSRFADQYNSDYFQTEILYTPNERLVVNGNIGYRNDNLSGNNNRFIGDVDIEYILTESGKLRMKFYSHTVDRYQLRDAKTTQGLGLLYKEDFNSIKDMFQYYWRILSNVGNKKTEEEEQTEQTEIPLHPNENIQEESYNEEEQQ